MSSMTKEVFCVYYTISKGFISSSIIITPLAGFPTASAAMIGS